MNNKNGRRRSRLALHAVLAASLLGGSGAALADRWGIQAGGGFSDRHSIDKGSLGVVWDPGWTWWEIGGWHFAFVMEGNVSYWHTNGNVHTSIWEVGATPMFRFIKSAGAVRPYVEAGAGIRLLSHPTISNDLSMSTAFQFADVAGVGVQFGQRQQYQVGYRFQHVSNAGIKEPNPGINFHQFYLQYNF
ncbi:deacylase [Burkholderia ubonensis]|uniref:Lipid A deacylase n=1 Tax=Burkholderia ubonensis TaxID=101571 RepID=A0A119NRR0_9BURK|nr:acyloxyacyl hydrolase [Burkholderia ubonensis]AOJ75888.1 deacylase [Burkholderia ubonensis]KWE64277.1 deacylase [Burkholderia ubonensis]KWE73476.1 deacylase [Burkholderia ubonensis]KWK71914.1 deacylase [Burkholderia ubonensis]